MHELCLHASIELSVLNSAQSLDAIVAGVMQEMRGVLVDRPECDIFAHNLESRPHRKNNFAAADENCQGSEGQCMQLAKIGWLVD